MSLALLRQKERLWAMQAQSFLVHLEQRTEPHSQRFLGPEQPVRYVLEVNAGEADGLRRGGGWRLDIPALAGCLIAQGDEAGDARRP